MIKKRLTDEELILSLNAQLTAHEFLIDPNDIRDIIARFDYLLLKRQLGDIRTESTIESLPEQEERLYSESEQL